MEHALMSKRKSQARCKNEACRQPSLGSWSGGNFIPSGHISAGSQIHFMDVPGRGLVAVIQCTYCRTEHIVYYNARRKRLEIDLYQPANLSVAEDGSIIVSRAEQPQRTLVPVGDTFEYDVPED